MFPNRTKQSVRDILFNILHYNGMYFPFLWHNNIWDSFSPYIRRLFYNGCINFVCYRWIFFILWNIGELMPFIYIFHDFFSIAFFFNYSLKLLSSSWWEKFSVTFGHYCIAFSYFHYVSTSEIHSTILICFITLVIHIMSVIKICAFKRHIQ